ncbi:MAG: hypothetical protein ACREQX_15185 [Candidatus Binataceae bacterium]
MAVSGALGSDLPPEQARLDMALIRFQVDRLNERDIPLLSDVARRRAVGLLEPWERTLIKRFEQTGVHVPDDPSLLRASAAA